MIYTAADEQTEKKMNELIQVLPAVALRGTTILPKMTAHFDVSRKRSVEAVTEAMVREQKLFLITQKDPAVEQPGLSDVYTMGTVVHVRQIVKMPKGLVRVMVEGEYRAQLLQFLTRSLSWRRRYRKQKMRMICIFLPMLKRRCARR